MPEKIVHFRPVNSGGEPPDMEQRLRHVEQDVAVIKSTMATSSELHSTLRQHLMWTMGIVLGGLVGVAGIVFAIVRLAGG
ncbi:MAG: hypothetical protein COB05_05425 [Marinobacter sp.]|nr:MAG: hypothetical protein COB05_05425 [Marinobacter sp.]